MTYSGPVGIIGCDVLFLGEPEDALLEDEFGLGGSHGWPLTMRETRSTGRVRMDVEKRVGACAVKVLAQCSVRGWSGQSGVRVATNSPSDKSVVKDN